MQTQANKTITSEEHEFDLRKAKMPYGYADYVARELDVPTKRVYQVKYGIQINKQIELALLSIAIKYREEQTELCLAIGQIRSRIKSTSTHNQLSMF